MKIDCKFIAWAGFGLMLLGLLVPYMRIIDVDIMESTSGYKGLGLLFNLKAIGELNGLGYAMSIVAIGATAYAGYVAFIKPAHYCKAAIECGSTFVVLLIGYYFIESRISSQLGFLSGFIDLVKMGVAPWFYLLGAGAFYFASRCKTPAANTGTAE